jgi:hypothetical protein
VGGEAVAPRVARHMLIDLRKPCCLTHCLLSRRLVQLGEDPPAGRRFDTRPGAGKRYCHERLVAA